MSTFEVLTQRIKIEPHLNADSIELGIFDGYVSIVKKGQYSTGDLVVYIPEASVIPEWILKQQGFWDDTKNAGMLAGSAGNRVKAIKLRGVLSQGLVFPVRSIDDKFFISTPNGEIEVVENQDVSGILGITKYEPPIPACLAGEVAALPQYTLKYDIENYKKYPNVISENDKIVLSEKIHGTWCSLYYNKDLTHDELLNGNMFATSKGLSAQGLVLKYNDKNVNNAYNKTLEKMTDKLELLSEAFNSPVYILGEVFGPIQDLRYGYSDIQFRVFDIFIGFPNNGFYLDKYTMVKVCEQLGLDTVPILYMGSFSKEKLQQFTDGTEQVSGNECHIREGVVINVIPEQNHFKLGRVVLKSVSEHYLTRKNKNATEYN